MYHQSMPRLGQIRDGLGQNTTPSRKRKAEADVEPDFSIPSSSASVLTSISHNTVTKRARRKKQARALNLSRILESLDADALRNVIESICVARPDVHHELVRAAPRPTSESCIKLLGEYEARFRNAFPFGDSESSDYAFHRVQPHLIAMLDALKDYTPSFLPPTEAETTVSLTFLDSVTELVHRIPSWDSFDHNRHRDDAYDELADAWSVVVREAAKRGAGFQFVNFGWDVKLMKHNDLAKGRLDAAVAEVKTQISWQNKSTESSCGPAASWTTEDSQSIRRRLFEGSSHGTAVHVGPW